MSIINKIVFTDREYDIIACLISGKTAKSIGIVLKISPNTVNVHIRNIAFKIQRTNKNDIIKFAEESNEYELLRKRYDELIGNSNRFDRISVKSYSFFPSIRNQFSKKAIFSIFAVLISLIIVLHSTKNDNIVKSVSHNIGEDKLLYRSNIENEIKKAFRFGNMKIAILLGAGGSGKTTVARYYMLKENASIIFQINCENVTSIWQSIYELANLLATSKDDMNTMIFIKNLENESVKRKKLVQFISCKLQKIRKWGLLFDNVRNFSEIRECFPNDRNIWGTGFVIITTRNANIADVSIFKKENIIKIGELSSEEKQTLFYKITGHKYPKEELKIIPSMPLDVCIAAHYVQESGVKLRDYISFLHDKKSDSFTQELMENTIGYDKTRYSIVTASFEEIIKQNQFYKELLLMICLLNSQNISTRYLLRYTDENTINKFLFLLKKYSLIDSADGKITIHRATQQIGIEYLHNMFSEEERAIVVDKITYAMTPYSELMWYLYDDQQHQMTHKEIREIVPHLETLKTNIEKLNIPNRESYISRILLAMLYAYNLNSSRQEARKLAKGILERGRGYIVGYDLAALIVQYAYSGLPSLQREDEMLLKKCIEICKELHAYNLQAFAEAYLATFYCQQNDLKQCKQHLSYAMNIAKTKKMRLLMNYRYCSLYLDMHVGKEEMKKVIDFTLSTLDLFDANRFFYLGKEKYDDFEGTSTHCIAALRKILISLYNAVENYKIAEKNYREAKFFYTQRRKRNSIDTLKYENYIDIEYAYTLLRTDRLKEANKLLEESINELLARNYTVYNAFLYKSEIDIRLKKWDKAKHDIEMAKAYQLNTNATRQKILKLKLLFNKSVIDFHFGEAKNFKKDIAEFYLTSKMFSPKNDMNFLNLDLPNSQTNMDKLLKKHLDYAYGIFVQVLGKNHSFIRNYINTLIKE